MSKTRYACPHCKKSFIKKSESFPFCCERCRMLDLGSWASEHYRVGPASTQTKQSNSLAMIRYRA